MNDNVVTLKGGKILVIGDLHLSATYEGTHKNYIYDCYNNMELIIKHVKEEKPKAIFFLGDLIGVKERNIRDRQFLMRVVLFFGSLYNLTEGNVYSVKGNHDVGDFSDFDFLVGLGYVKTPRYIDYVGDESLEVRFHFVNYGEEKRKLDIAEEASNIVLGHADYYIDGISEWYSAKQGVELKMLKNFIGVDMVISGHIHTPSNEILYTTLPDGNSVGLFYVGSPSRTAERFEDCVYLTFEYDEKDGYTNYKDHLFGLPSVADTFYPKEDYNLDEEEATEEKQSRVLDEIVKEVIDSRLFVGDVMSQVDLFPARKEVKALAKEYLRKAIES